MSSGHNLACRGHYGIVYHPSFYNRNPHVGIYNVARSIVRMDRLKSDRPGYSGCKLVRQKAWKLEILGPFKRKCGGRAKNSLHRAIFRSFEMRRGFMLETFLQPEAETKRTSSLNRWLFHCVVTEILSYDKLIRYID